MRKRKEKKRTFWFTIIFGDLRSLWSKGGVCAWKNDIASAILSATVIAYGHSIGDYNKNEL